MKTTATMTAITILSLATACLPGCVAGQDGEDLEGVDEAAGALCDNLPTSCIAIKSCGIGSVNGSYTLYANGLSYQPWNAYCTDMTTASPKTYLTLSKTDTNSNYAQQTETNGTVTSRYTKLHIEPASFFIDSSDQSFAIHRHSGAPITIGGVPVGTMPFGVAGSCTTAGPANVDLRGLPFAVAGAPSAFVFTGTNGQSLSQTYSNNNQTVDLFGGGSCGAMQPAPGNSNPINNGGGYYLGLNYQASCADGLQNGEETGVDCGGPCGACPTGITIPAGSFSTGVQGGSGGAAFDDPCPASGQVLIGFNARSYSNANGSALTQLEGVCGSVSLSAASPPSPTHPYDVIVTAGGTTSPAEGTLSNGPPLSAMCPANQIVVGFTGTTYSVPSGVLMGQLGAVCAPLVVTLTEGTYSLSLGSTSEMGNLLNPSGGGAAFPTTMCGAGQVAKKPMGRSGDRVSALNLRCTSPALAF